jgi:uncharacterized protein YbcC (UPF0753/DUF2309 family)
MITESLLSPVSKQVQLTTSDEIRATVAKAANIVSPVWPLKTIIACNPLQGLEDLPFETAVAQGDSLFRQTDTSPELASVNRQLIKWCVTFLDEGQATWVMPDRKKGFYRAWKQLVSFDTQVHQGKKADKQWLTTLPENAADALAVCLDKLNVAPDGHEAFLKKSLTQLPGWSGYIKWRESDQPGLNPITLVDFLAVRLAITCCLWPEAAHQPNQVGLPGNRMAGALATLKHNETTYQTQLVDQLMTQLRFVNPLRQRPDAHLIFCIDVRSEPFRRSIEAQGNYETLGFAGFFGLPIRLNDTVTGAAHDSCPVLLKPSHTIDQKPTATAQEQARFWRGKRVIDTLRAFYQQLKYNFSTPFALVETLGAGCGLLMLERTLAPTLSVQTRHRFTEAIRPGLPTAPDTNDHHHHHGIAPEQQAVYAEGALRLMGLTDNFGKLVVLCGHGSSTQNNPYSSALDCGACGGNHGGANAQLLAALLNTPSVRKVLASHALRIPADTVFLAAEHNTTTDDVVIYGAEHKAIDQAALADLRRKLTLAKVANSAYRCRTFGNGNSTDPARETLRRSNDWAEVRPEWGLARNAAFVVGPRQLTEKLDLEGRCFLHSYNWEQDTNHTHLETILTAPMVVAQWINSQYLFSTLDPVAYGSGSKVTHNVTGKLGIMQGNASDLMHGLPLQSVKRSDTETYHEPQRLCTVVMAPRARIDLLVARQPVLQKLFFNEWVTLVALDPTDTQAYRLTPTGDWALLES